MSDNAVFAIGVGFAILALGLAVAIGNLFAGLLLGAGGFVITAVLAIEVIDRWDERS